MGESKPSVFIGSSSEALPVARAIQNRLAEVAYTDVWKDLEGRANSTVIEWLVDNISKFDFAVMVFSPDDQSTMRDETSPVPRDNVLFELGLFMGLLGRERTFIVEEEAAQLRRPSDLRDVRAYRYERRDGQQPDANVASNKIIDHIRRQGRFRGISRDQDEPSLAEKVSRLREILLRREFKPDLIIGISRGGLAVAGLLSTKIGGRHRVPTMSLWAYPDFDNAFNQIAFQRDTFFGNADGLIRILIVDNICRAGGTLNDAKSYVRKSINFSGVEIETAALTCYERVREFDPTFIVETSGEEIEAFGGATEPWRLHAA